MGMFDTVYISNEMCAKMGLPPGRTDYQTKDMESLMFEYYLADDQLFEMFKKETRPYPLTGKIIVYDYVDQEADNEEDIFLQLTFVDGKLTHYEQTEQRGWVSPFPESPFAKEREESYVQGAESFLEHMREARRNRPIHVKARLAFKNALTKPLEFVVKYLEKLRWFLIRWL